MNGLGGSFKLSELGAVFLLSKVSGAVCKS